MRDKITAFQTHYFWPNLEDAMKETFRVLKQGGEFFIIAETYKINYHMTAYKTHDALRKLFKETGFEKIEFFENKSKGWICVKGCKKQ
ncbi:methyltransferase domain-containing protein [Bacillus manliponensis]|uniref:methyltransferase domain-containing protein n=1 Tax=Bacillus manliponensis TaxID=574376 RepID=UPI00068F1F93|nr:methyltransferase domain-containing protein [Bacillus manliponensis]